VETADDTVVLKHLRLEVSLILNGMPSWTRIAGAGNRFESLSSNDSIILLGNRWSAKYCGLGYRTAQFQNRF